MDFYLNDIVVMKKNHPCKKSNEWQIVRIGADVKIKCLGCGAIIMMPRHDFNKKLKKNLSAKIIRPIEKKDNQAIKKLIQETLEQYDGKKPGCAYFDESLNTMYEHYQNNNSVYLVVEVDGKIVGGCGIGPVANRPGLCELQKMYFDPSIRGIGLSHKILRQALDFAIEHYQYCYIETFSNMVEANRFYQKQGFEKLLSPLSDEHPACDVWYLKKL